MASIHHSSIFVFTVLAFVHHFELVWSDGAGEVSTWDLLMRGAKPSTVYLLTYMMILK